MRLLQATAVVLAGSIGLAACAPPDKAQHARAEVDVARWTALIDGLAGAVAGDGSDCAKMASDVTGLIQHDADLVKAANSALGDGFKLPDDAKARIAAAVSKMLPGIDACGAEPAVQKAFKLAKPPSDVPSAVVSWSSHWAA